MSKGPTFASREGSVTESLSCLPGKGPGGSSLCWRELLLLNGNLASKDWDG